MYFFLNQSGIYSVIWEDLLSKWYIALKTLYFPINLTLSVDVNIVIACIQRYFFQMFNRLPANRERAVYNSLHGAETYPRDQRGNQRKSIFKRRESLTTFPRQKVDSEGYRDNSRENKNDYNKNIKHRILTFHSAILSGNTEIAMRSIKSGDVNVNSRDAYGDSALHIATKSGRKEMVRILLEANANVNIDDRLGNTPLHIAVMADKADMVKLLLEANADVNLQDRSGEIALHKVVVFDRQDIAKILIESHSDVNIQDWSGDTPLHKAVKSGKMEMIKMLLEANANVTIKNRFEFTPWNIASRSGRNVLTMLLEANTDDIKRH